MIKTKIFTFNAFQENTIVVYDEQSKQAIVFDPGNSNGHENNQLSGWIALNKLQIIRLINTHCHIDHIMGNKYVSDKYQVALEAHKGEELVLASGVQVSKMYGISYTPSPPIEKFLTDQDTIPLGGTEFKILFTPGHSPASLCFYNERDKYLIGGDVLFHGSIGRSDLPGGNHNTLIESIKHKLMILPDAVTVYPGHGPSTTIGFERRNNPFLNE